MAIIKQLDQHVANLIAAGEVIERAASVVKELVENSIDANAKNITIHLIDSGVTEIRVIDDGDGMDPTDAKMCVLPHATSKIKNESDLFTIQTLGFRGEALPSIVAVSNFRMITSIDGHKGYMFSLKGGIQTSEAIVAHDKGTEIAVKNLFFNTPARLQNLQSQNIELSHISDLITKMALSNPNISFLLTNNEKAIIRTNGNGDVLEVIANIVGNESAKNMFKVFDTNGTYRISGYISNNTITRSNKNYMYIFVNGRIIKSYNINNAIIKGYDTLLMNGRYPLVALNIEADVSLVDVNVHPTKAEVRFYDEEGLLTMITNMIASSLKKQDLSINMCILNSNEDDKNKISINNENNSNQQTNEFEYEEKDNDDDVFINNEYNENDEQQDLLLKEDNSIDEIEEDEEDDNDLFINVLSEKNNFEYQDNKISQEPETFSQQQFNLTNDEIIDEGTKQIDKIGFLSYIGQLFGTYILAQSEDELVVIDQHAAAERINYEKILNSLQNSENVGYDLLVPFNLEFTPAEVVLVNENMQLINDLGIKLEEFGSNSFVVRSIPIWIFRGREKEFVEEIITQIIVGRKTTKIEFLNSLAKSLACKKSIKANEYHNQIEIEYMLEDLRNTSNPYTCPHGRPIIIKFNKNEIEKWFKRIV